MLLKCQSRARCPCVERLDDLAGLRSLAKAGSRRGDVCSLHSIARFACNYFSPCHRLCIVVARAGGYMGLKYFFIACLPEPNSLLLLHIGHPSVGPLFVSLTWQHWQRPM